ncbi:MAG: AI-2E family transporter [Eubacteriales bacterium]
MQEEKVLDESTNKEKIITLFIIILIFIVVWNMLDLALLTFIFTYIFYSLLDMISRNWKKVNSIKIPDPLIIMVLYVIFAAIVVAVSYRFIPVIMAQLSELWKIVVNFNVTDLKDDLDPRIYDIISKIDYNSYISGAGVLMAGGAKKVGSFGITIFISLILSLFLLLEKHKIKIFGESLENSRISSIYKHFIFFGTSFVKSFGKVMQVQVIISLVNTILSCIVLVILGFPQIIGLAVMIFALGLIPVMGVVVSFIPLSIIGYNMGGFPEVLIILIMILVVHFVGTYMLYPKLMADKTELPICFIFIVLIIGEHYMGVWGLLIGVPISIFLLDLMNIQYVDEAKLKKISRKKVAEN